MKPPTITRIPGRFEIDDKRLHLPFRVSDDCPECGTDRSLDLADDEYFSNPLIGQPQSIDFYCGECGHEWMQLVVLEVSLRPATTPVAERDNGTSNDDAVRSARIIEIAGRIGAHWRDQEGVNAMLLDELAEATR